MDNELRESILTMNYLMVNDKDISTSYLENSDLFPFGWLTEIDFDTRCMILNEAIDKKIKIQDTDLYTESISDIRSTIKR